MIAVVSDSYGTKVDGISTIINLGLMPSPTMPRVLIAAAVGRRRAVPPATGPYVSATIIPALSLGPARYPVVLRMRSVYRELDRLSPTVVEIHTIGVMGLIALHWARRHSRRVELVYHTDLESYAKEFKLGAALLVMLMFALGLLRPSARSLLARDPVRAVLSDFLDLFDVVYVLSPKAAALLKPRLSISTEVQEITLSRQHDPVRRQPRDRRSCARPRVGYVGRISREKGLSLLLESFDVVANENAIPEFVFVGPPGDRRTMQELGRFADSHGQRVTYLGSVRHAAMHDVYRSLDVILLPSSTETLCLTLHEALDAGTHVVLADGDLWTGELPPHLHLTPRSPEGMAATLTRVLSAL